MGDEAQSMRDMLTLRYSMLAKKYSIAPRRRTSPASSAVRVGAARVWASGVAPRGPSTSRSSGEERRSLALRPGRSAQALLRRSVGEPDPQGCRSAPRRSGKFR